MKHKQGKLDISGLEIDALNKIGETIETGLRKVVSEALHYAFEGGDIYFPVELAKKSGAGTDGIGGPEVTDPLTVHFCAAYLAAEDDEDATYEFNLREVLANTIEACAEDGSFSTGLGRLSASLRELADEIDAARAKSNANYPDQ